LNINEDENLYPLSFIRHATAASVVPYFGVTTEVTHVSPIILAPFYRQRAATNVHSRATGSSLHEFCTLSVDDVISSVRRLPDKSSDADPIPTFVLKQIIDLLAPFITELFNRSLTTGHFPGRFKDAFITPIAKKAGLDPADASSYRPISNLPVLSKLLERLVVHQLMNYLTLNNLLPSLQSGFRPGHSTETAILLVLSEIIQAVDRGDFAALVLLDLSAAFDTVDHEILLQRLHVSYGINGQVLQWFRSYLIGRTQHVRRGRQLFTWPAVFSRAQ